MRRKLPYLIGMQNHFELFGLPARFEVDMGALDAAYREVQGRVHPDRFVNASDAEKRVAMQWATRANEAYQTLRNPMLRARYLCDLAQLLEETSRTDEAIATINKALALDPGHGGAYAFRGMVAAKRNDVVSAMPDLEKALNSYAVDEYYGKAYDLVLSGKAKDAMDLEKETQKMRFQTCL